MKAMIPFGWYCLIAGGLLFDHSGCKPLPSGDIEGRYLRDLVVCVDNAKTRAEADLCRKGVDERYGVSR